MSDVRATLERGPRTGVAMAVVRMMLLFVATSKFAVPIARPYAQGEWCEAINLSLSGNVHGKIILLPA